MLDDDLIPSDALPCPYCRQQVMIPYEWFYECPKCGGECLAPVNDE